MLRPGIIPALLICAAALQIPVYPQSDNPNVSRETIENKDIAGKDGAEAANWQLRLNLFHDQARQRQTSAEAVKASEKETAAAIASLRGKWVKTPYLSTFDRAYQARLHGKTPTDPAQRYKNFTDALEIYGGGLALLFVIMRFLWNFAKGTPVPKPSPPPQLSQNYGTASYAPQALTIPHQLYTVCGVFFGKSSSPDVNGMPLTENPGAPIVSMPENHTLIVARTRTGKGTRVVIPTLLRYFSGSMLAIDPKGENAAITARARSALNKVHIINPWGELAPTFQELGFQSATYNPLDILDRDDPNAVATAQALASAICPKDAKGKDSYWSDAAGSILTAVLLWLTDQPGEQKTLGRAREIVSKSRADFTKNYLTKMAASEAFGGAIQENAASFLDLAPETYSGVMSNLAQHTRFLSDPQVKASTSRSSFSMDDLMRQLTTVYLVIPPDRIDTQRTWLRLLITAGMQTFKRRHTPGVVRCMFLIDEFAALGNIPELPRDIATMSGYGVDFTLIIQGIDQLKDCYGDAHATILSNCAYKWFCNVNDLHSAEYLSKTLGKATVQTVGRTISDKESTTFGETGRELLKPDEVLNLGKNAAILLHPNSPPHYLRPVDYWQLPEAFATLKGEYPHLYWEPPLNFDPNPYHQAAVK